jgi:hypothetical protein
VWCAFDHIYSRVTGGSICLGKIPLVAIHGMNVGECGWVESATLVGQPRVLHSRAAHFICLKPCPMLPTESENGKYYQDQGRKAEKHRVFDNQRLRSSCLDEQTLCREVSAADVAVTRLYSPVFTPNGSKFLGRYSTSVARRVTGDSVLESEISNTTISAAKVSGVPVC